MACAVAHTALKVLVEEKMGENSANTGAYLLEGLRRNDSRLIHISPPMLIQRDELDWTLEPFEAVLAKNKKRLI